jgi:hypothetical protein
MNVIERYLAGMEVDPNDPVLQTYLMQQRIYGGGTPSQQEFRNTVIPRDPVPSIPNQGPIAPPDMFTPVEGVPQEVMDPRGQARRRRQTERLPDVPMGAQPNIDTPQTTVFRRSNAYLAAYNQAKTSQYFQMLDLLLKQQTVEQGNLDIIRKAIADIDDRIADYEKAAAEFETPKSSGGRGSSTVKNFRLEAEAEINRLALKSLEQQTRLTEQVGRDTQAPTSTLSFFTGDSSNRVNSINANPSDMSALISQVRQPTYVNQFASITNTTARNEATGELIRQVMREMVAAGVPSTEQEKVFDLIAANYGGLASSTPASRSSQFSNAAVASQREAEMQRKLGDVYDLKDASTVQVPASQMRDGVPTLNPNQYVKTTFSDGTIDYYLTNEMAIRQKAEEAQAFGGGGRTRPTITQSAAEKELDNFIIGNIRDDGKFVLNENTGGGADLVAKAAGKDLGELTQEDIDRVLRDRIGASVRVQQAQAVGELTQQRSAYSDRLAAGLRGMSPEEYLGRAAQMRDKPFAAGTTPEEARRQMTQSPSRMDAEKFYADLTPQQRLQADYMSQATAMAKRGDRQTLDKDEQMLYSTMIEKLEKGELTRPELYDAMMKQAYDLYGASDIEKAQKKTKSALTSIYLDDIAQFQLTSGATSIDAPKIENRNQPIEPTE